MKSFFAILVAFALTASATPTMAYVVQIATSVDLSNATDDAQVGNAVAAAIEDVLSHAIAFSPTVVTLQSARVVGDRMYLLLPDAARRGSFERSDLDGRFLFVDFDHLRRTRRSMRCRDAFV